MSSKYVKEALKDLVPPERREELKKQWEEINQKIKELENQIIELRKKRRSLESILVALGEIERSNVPPAEIRGGKRAAVKKYIESLPPGTEFKFTDVVKETGMSRSVVWSALRVLEEGGLIEKIGRGLYRVAKKEESGENDTGSSVPSEGDSGETKKKGGKKSRK